MSVTSKGQATIPKDLREKFGVGKKVIVSETKDGILLKPLPSPKDDFGSLRTVFKGQSSKEVLEEARAQEWANEKRRRRKTRSLLLSQGRE